MDVYSAILVGLGSATFTFILTQGAMSWRQSRSDRATHKAWLNAIKAEAIYIEGVIAQADDQLKSFAPFTKRMNRFTKGLAARLVPV